LNFAIHRHKEGVVTKYQVLEITRLVIVQDEDKSTRKKEVVRYKKVWRRNTKPKEQVNKEYVPKIVGFAVVQERKEQKMNKKQVHHIVLS
jgi:hypothetical protein